MQKRDRGSSFQAATPRIAFDDTTTAAATSAVSTSVTRPLSASSPASNRLQTLREAMVHDKEKFQYALEKKAVSLSSEGNQLRQNMLVLDQHVVHEARHRQTEDAAIAKFIQARAASAANEFSRFLRQHTSTVAQRCNDIENKTQQLISDTEAQRGTQEKLLQSIRNDHHDAIEALRKDMSATRTDVHSFESQFTSELTRSIRQAEDRMTVEFSIQKRSSNEIMNEVRAMLNKNDAKKAFESDVGRLMVHVDDIRKRIALNESNRKENGVAFAETMDAMVVEVHDAVKKMNLSRGMDNVIAKRKSRLEQSMSLRTAGGGGSASSPHRGTGDVE